MTRKPGELKDICEVSGGNEHALINAAKNYDPAKVTHYATELATHFHKFYNNCRVGVEDESLMQARLFLCICTRDTLKSILNMLKVNSPERM